MPVRIPRAGSSEILCFGVGGVAAFAPLYMMMPGATERVASQTARWAPRWYASFLFFAFTLNSTGLLFSSTIHDTCRTLNNGL